MSKRIYTIEVDAPDEIEDVWIRGALAVAVAQELRAYGVSDGFSVGTSGGKLETPVHIRPRLAACVLKWPECKDGEYNPSCCRFPKSCSCSVYSDEVVKPYELERVADG